MREASGTASVSDAVPSPTSAPGSGPPRDVAGRHDEREPECHLAVDTGKQACKLDLHGRPLARRQIADGDGQDILPFLFAQGRPVPVAEGLLVRLPGVLTLQERALDHAAVDLHPEGGYRCPGRDRKDVDGLHGLVEGVDEGLTDGGLLPPQQRCLAAEAPGHRPHLPPRSLGHLRRRRLLSEHRQPVCIHPQQRTDRRRTRTPPQRRFPVSPLGSH
jgi:hypothetical protein